MNVTEQEFMRLKEHTTVKMIQIMTEERGMDIEEALDKLYSSRMYEKLSDAETGLFYQSPRYLLSYI